MFQSVDEIIPLSNNCFSMRSLNKILNLERNLSIKLVNLTSSLEISSALPRIKPESCSCLEGGTLSALYYFVLKYSTSANSPRFSPPGNVEISVPLPPSLRGSQ